MMNTLLLTLIGTKRWIEMSRKRKGCKGFRFDFDDLVLETLDVPDDPNSFEFEAGIDKGAEETEAVKSNQLQTSKPATTGASSSTSQVPSTNERRAKLVEEIDRKYIVIYSNARYYVYNDEHGYFEHFSDDKFATFISKEHGKPAENSNYFTAEAFGQFKRDNRMDDDNEFNQNRNLINFQDGVYDFVEKRILEHAPEYFFNYYLPINICDESGKMPIFSNFVMTLCQNNAKKVRRLQEFLGVLISPLTPKCAFFLIGADNCGKTTLANFIEDLFGEEFVSAVALENMDKPFEFADMYGKKLNVCDEVLPEYKASAWSAFKRVTGKGKVHINQKNKPVFSTTLDVKMLVTGNFLPIIPDDKSLIDRLQVIFFNYTVPASQRDPYLLEKLHDERNAIIRWALEGLDRYIVNGFTFTVDRETKEFLQDCFARTDSVQAFLDEHVEYREGNLLQTRLIYEAYHKYCDKHGIVENARKSGKIIHRAIMFTFPHALKKKDGTLQAFLNIALRD